MRGPFLALAGAVALLLVATATTVAVLAEPAHSPATGPGADGPEGPGGRVLAAPFTGPTRTVAASGVRFAVPRAPGWSVSRAGTIVGFDEIKGTVLSAPAYLRRGWCPRDRRWSSRALVGVVPAAATAARASVRRTSRGTAAAWRNDLAGERRPVGTRVSTRRVRLADGSSGWLATARTAVPADGSGCAPPAVTLAVLSVDAGDGVATVVALRDVGVPGALPASVVRRILAGVRVAGAS